MKKNAPVIIACAITLGYAAGNYAVFHAIMNRKSKTVKKIIESVIAQKEPLIKPDDERLEWFSKQNFSEIEIRNSDNQKLYGYFIKADEASDKYIICAHGYRSCGKNEFCAIAKFLHESGYNILLIDHRAAGKSDGKYITFGLKESEDMLLWVQYIIDRFGENSKIGLYGISMGSATVTSLCGNDLLPDNVKFAVADCGYTCVYDEFTYHLKNAHIPSEPVIKSFDIINKALSKCSVFQMSPLQRVKKSKVPILFIHGEKDDFVPTEMVYTLYDNCTAPKDLFISENAEHAESYPANSDKYEQKFSDFTKKYMEE